MILQPCVRCSFRTTCELKRETLRRARGLNLATARIKCPIRLAGLRNGQRVAVKIHNAIHHEENYHRTDYYESRIYNGVVLRPSKSGHKLLVWLDEPLETQGGQETGRVRVNIHHDNLTPIVGFDPICDDCGNPTSKSHAAWCGQEDRG